jgi:hypothetical protein
LEKRVKCFSSNCNFIKILTPKQKINKSSNKISRPKKKGEIKSSINFSNYKLITKGKPKEKTHRKRKKKTKDKGPETRKKGEKKTHFFCQKMKESTNHMKNARAIAAASLPSHCLIISCPKSSPKLQIWTQIFFIIIIFFFFTQICITQISFFFFFIQMLLNSWFSIRVWEDTDRQTDRQTEICHWAPFLF